MILTCLHKRIFQELLRPNLYCVKKIDFLINSIENIIFKLFFHHIKLRGFAFFNFYLSSMARFHNLKEPNMSRFLSTNVAPKSSKASILSCLDTKSALAIRYSTICIWPVTAAASKGVMPGTHTKKQTVNFSFVKANFKSLKENRSRKKDLRIRPSQPIEVKAPFMLAAVDI